MSVSMEIERWNLLVNQLDDVLNLVNFCLSLELDGQKILEKEGKHPTKCAEYLSTLSVLSKYRKYYIYYIHRTNIAVHERDGFKM